jgi:septal ring factor EnvC (AmiA/AmiB activator)
MKIIYSDEYGEEIVRVESGNIPTMGDTISIDDEDWKVKSRVFIPKEDSVVIEITQNMVRSKSSDDNGARLAEMQHAIIAVNKRQDTQDKKSRQLREQIGSVKTYLRNRDK